MDWVALVEAIYDLEHPSLDRWLSRVATALGPQMNGGQRPAIGGLFHMERGRVHCFAAGETDAAFVARVAALEIRDDDLLARLMRGRPATTASMVVGARRLARGLGPTPGFHSSGIRDSFGVFGRDAGPWGVCITAELARVTRLSAAVTAPWERVGAHLHAALRLRFRLHGRPAAPPVSASNTDAPSVYLHRGVDAVLSPSGKIEHAEPSAQAFAGALRQAAVSIDRARARMRREDPVGALDAWRSLVEGEWSLVETFESDGRRFLVARRNPPHAPRIPLLDDRERCVLGLRARSHGLKLIAYELGTSQSSVARSLASGMAKLGLSSVAELARFGL